jgi:hypothetical protein
MAVTETTGPVSWVKVNATQGESFALCQVMDTSTQPATAELFFLWWEALDRAVPTGPQWMHRALQVSLLRDAITAGKTVTVFHDTESAIVNSLELQS